MGAYRQRRLTGRRRRPAWVVPATVTQTVKHSDVCGRLLSMKIRAELGGMGPVSTVHVERLNGALRDRESALTRKMHAFAKWDASLRCTRGLATLRSQLSLGEAAACWGRSTSLSLPISGDSPGANQSSLVVPRIVVDSDSYHPLKGLPPTSRSRYYCFNFKPVHTRTHFS